MGKNIQIDRIAELLPFLLQHLEIDRSLVVTSREEIILHTLLSGASYEEVGQKFQISSERVRQIWHKVLTKLINAKNAIEFRDEQILDLQKEIERLQDTIANMNAQPKSQFIVDNADVLVLPITALGLSTRAQRGLIDLRINHVLDLVKAKRNDIRKLPNMGKTSVKEIDCWLNEHNLSYNMDIPEEVDVIMLEKFIQSHDKSSI